MDRREFLEAIAGVSALGSGLSLVPALCQEGFARELHARAHLSGPLRTLTPAEDATLTCIADLLLPKSDTIGATEVGVNRFIDLLLSEAMLEAQRDRFLAGLAAIDARSQSSWRVPFVSASRQHQESLLRTLDSQLPRRNPAPAEASALGAEPVTAEVGFAMLKHLVVLAYFTSEPVSRGLIKPPIIPGRYDGCVPV